VIDLHIHTNNSDGHLDSISVLKKAEANHLKVISITDHNNVLAYSQIDNISKYYQGKLIPGVELEFLYNGILMDMLGYNIDINKISKDPFLLNNLEHTTLEKENKNLKFFESVCDKLGIIYSPNLMVTKKGQMANDVIRDDIITYLENESILKQMNIIEGGFSWNHMRNPKSPFYIDQTINKETIYSVAKMIKDAGGICFLAHPYAYQVPDIEKVLEEIIQLKVLDGIEVYHKRHTKENTEYLIDFCNKHGLKKCGGSDFHHENQILGFGNHGTLKIDETIINDWYHH